MNLGQTTTLHWQYEDAAHCHTSGPWSGSPAAPSGSISTGALQQSATFTLTCSNALGSTTEMVRVTVMGEVQVSWDAPETNTDGSVQNGLSEYRIYVGDTSGDYRHVGTVDDSVRTYQFAAEAQQAQYIAVTAVGLTGAESDYSDEVMKFAQ